MKLKPSALGACYTPRPPPRRASRERLVARNCSCSCKQASTCSLGLGLGLGLGLALTPTLTLTLTLNPNPTLTLTLTLTLGEYLLPRADDLAGDLVQLGSRGPPRHRGSRRRPRRPRPRRRPRRRPRPRRLRRRRRRCLSHGERAARAVDGLREGGYDERSNHPRRGPGGGLCNTPLNEVTHRDYI